MSRSFVVAAILAFLPQLASARPAVIRVFEAEARARPSSDAAVVHRFAENAEVSVSDEVTDGWRRIRLEDGGVAWIEDAAVALRELPNPTAAPSPAPRSMPPRPPVAATTADLRPRIYVKDVNHLAELMRTDAKIGKEARSLADRHTATLAVLGIGGAVSAGLVIAGFSDMGPDNPEDPRFGEPPPGRKLIMGGMVGFAATALLALAIQPKYGEILDVVNAWNVAHPDKPFELQPIVAPVAQVESGDVP